MCCMYNFSKTLTTKLKRYVEMYIIPHDLRWCIFAANLVYKQSVRFSIVLITIINVGNISLMCCLTSDLDQPLTDTVLVQL